MIRAGRIAAALGLCVALAGLGPVPLPVPRPQTPATQSPAPAASLAVPPGAIASGASKGSVSLAGLAPADPAPQGAADVVALVVPEDPALAADPATGEPASAPDDDPLEPAATQTPAADPSALGAVPATDGPGTALRARAGFSGASGWFLVDLDTGRVLDQGAADRAFAPASVAKLPTAVYALERLGADHRFTTRLATTGPVRDGVIHGDLVLIGGGDPELDTDNLAQLFDAARSTGITGVTGHLIVDGGRGVRVAQIDPLQPVDVGYNPGLSALNLNFNRVRVSWDGNRTSPRLSLTAQAERTATQVGLISAMPDPNPQAPIFAFHSDDNGEHWRMATRAMRGMSSTWLPVKMPDLYAGDVLRHIADTRGILLERPQRGEAPLGAPGLARLDSRPLQEILRDMLKHSTNLTAESVGMAASAAAPEALVAEAAPPRPGLGALLGMVLAPRADAIASAGRSNQPQSLAESARAMNAWAAQVIGLPGTDPGFDLVNHSGLSADSRVSPRRLVQFLAAVARRPVAPDAAHPRLPGPIAGLLKGYNAADKNSDLDFGRLDIAAKTGTMDYVRGLAGYIATPGGRRLAFAIFSNDLDRRRPGVAVGGIDKGWMARARGFERALIRAWVERADSRAG